jgi:hypothetical protein
MVRPPLECDRGTHGNQPVRNAGPASAHRAPGSQMPGGHTMTVTATPPTRDRTHPPHAHAYTVPVVRELPTQPVEIRDAHTW